MPEPARYVDMQEVTAAHAALRVPGDTPLGGDTLSELASPTRESIMPDPPYLDPELCWVMPGLLYCVMGLDKSVFHLFSWAMKRDVQVCTHLAPTALIDLVSSSSKGHPWLGTVQGVSPELSGRLVDYIESFRFNDPRGNAWCACAHQMRIRDPFSAQDTGVSVVLFLPECLTTGRWLALESEYNLGLERPRVVVRGVGS